MTLPPSLTDSPSDPSLAGASAELAAASHDPRALRILAKTIYRELRQGGLLEEDVMSLASELLGLVAGEVKDRRRSADRFSPSAGADPLRDP
jgi:hypothetical protein